MERSGVLALPVALGALLPATGAAAQALELPAGRLRLGVDLTNAAFVTKDAATGELRGIVIDVGRALAARLGVPLEPVEYASLAQRLDGLRAGQYDVTNASPDNELAALLDLSGPFAETDGTYLVPAGSPIMRVADADRPGVRIAVTRGTAPDTLLTAALRHATLVRAATGVAGVELLRAGEADAIATNRQLLLSYLPGLPGARVLEDRYATVQQALGVAKGRPALHARVSAFVEEAKAAGLIRQAIARAGVQGVQEARAGAAPPRLPRTGGATPLGTVSVGATAAVLGLVALRHARRRGQRAQRAAGPAGVHE